jgi:hypothetical protein
MVKAILPAVIGRTEPQRRVWVATHLQVFELSHYPAAKRFTLRQVAL